MRLQLLSDLHLETEVFHPHPAPGAELLVLAGDIDSTWTSLERFAGWPVPVLLVAGNHEFDRRELDVAWPALRERAHRFGVRLLERETAVLNDDCGRRIRFVATIRWCDFDLFGAAQRERCMRASRYFVEVMRSTRHGRVFDPPAVRQEALGCRDWLAAALADSAGGPVDATVVVTHFGPSLRSADPRYGAQPSTASFCNSDEPLMPGVSLWLHGHLHCRHDYLVPHADGTITRVVSNPRGLGPKGESAGYDALCVIEV
jgi:hypothetical protein